MTSPSSGVLIVGGGLAGQRCAESLRRHDYRDRIRIVCAEPWPPYDRPPLSKEALSEPTPADALRLRPAAWYAEHDVELLLGRSAVAVDPSRRHVTLGDGRRLSYDDLVVTTGSSPRPLPSLAGRANVSVLRTLPDGSALRTALATCRRLVIIGAGFIGQEVAASARALGRDVVLIEAASHPLAGLFGAELGSWFTALHTDEGVGVHTRRTVEAVEGNGRVRALRLSGGERIPADHVLVGVGVVPNCAWLRAGGIATPAGIPVDARGRTRAPRIYAAGDVAATLDPLTSTYRGGSHWESAARQGSDVAAAVLGRDPAPAPPPSFWSDQYGLRLQYVGHSRPEDHYEIEGDPSRRDFKAVFYRDNEAVAVLLVNRARELPAARRLIQKGAP